MKMKSLIAVLLLALGVTACSTVKKVVYRIDVPQGNYLEQDKIDQLKVGMNKEQVQYLLGTPLLKDTFNQNRWDYVFIKREGHNEPIQRTLFVYFNQKGLVSDIKLDQPLETAVAQSPKRPDNIRAFCYLNKKLRSDCSF